MSGKTVLITGISGFVATHVALQFLENGWNVRGTVRSQDKAKAVANLAALKPHADKLSFVVVEDLVSGDFSEAVKGVDAVAHTASPFHTSGKSWEDDYKKPAVKGTINVLSAAKKEPSIKHVVVTSSFAAIGDFVTPATEQASKVYTEDDWNPVTEEDCQKMKSDDPMAGSAWYCASKKFAELAAKDEAKDSGFTLATICPPMVFGPALHAVNSLDSLNTSSEGVYGIMKKDGSSVKAGVPDDAFPAFADVRNVGQAHYQAIAQGKSGRFIICSGNFSNQQMADFIRSEFPQIKDRVPEGKPGVRLDGKVFKLSAKRAEQELGIKLIPFDTCIKDTVNRLLQIEQEVSK